MKAEPQRTCQYCGNDFSGAMEFCPVCMLRKGLAGGTASGESSFEEAVKPAPDQPAQRFAPTPPGRKKLALFFLPFRFAKIGLALANPREGPLSSREILLSGMVWHAGEVAWRD
jgi:hypothetical protein